MGQLVEVDGPIRPFVTNASSCGTSTRLWTQVYATNSTINVSDIRFKGVSVSAEQLSEKMQVHADAILDAWGDVSIIAFQWLSDIQAKGEDKARWHFGAIAQQVRDALLAHGIDGTRFGLLCYDKWDDEYRPVMAQRTITIFYKIPEGEDTSYNVIEEYDTGEKELVMEAGDRWGLRPEECSWIEAAYLRRERERLAAKMARFEERLSALESQ